MEVILVIGQALQEQRLDFMSISKIACKRSANAIN
jgi:hypothetical protein